MSEWQAIETAPKDGTQILAFARDPVIDYQTFFGVAEWAPENAAFGSVEGWFWAYAIRPSHWMPLPEPPKPYPARLARTK